MGRTPPSLLRLSPAGRGAVTVLALRSRPNPGRLRSRAGAPRDWPAVGRATVGWLWHDGRALDEVLAVGTADGVELHLHGGPAIERAVVAAFGPVLSAESGPAPDSLAEARARLSARHGPLAVLVRRARAALERGRGDVELFRDLDHSLQLVQLGRALSRAPVVRLVGRPNAGKSTLFNALLLSERALASPAPGTTRDTVRALCVLSGVPVRLEDSAGGPPRTEGADLLLQLLALDEEAPAENRSGPVPRLVIPGQADRRANPPPGAVSGLTGFGVAALLDAITRQLGLGGGPDEHARAALDEGQIELFRKARDLPL